MMNYPDAPFPNAPVPDDFDDLAYAEEFNAGSGGDYADSSDDNEPTPILIKGSWEAVLAEAQQLASKQDDDAIPLFAKVVQRIGKMTVAQRLANSERLQKIFTVAAINAQSYLTLREHYDEALATLATLHDIGDSHDRAFAGFQRILVLFMADRTEQAFGELETRVHDDDADIADWGQLVMSNLRYRRLDEAAQALAAAQAWTDEQSELELISAEESREWRGYLATLYADVAMRRGEWDAAMGHFDEALAADPMYGKNLHLFYTTLMQAGQPARALTYIEQDSAYPIRSHFWHGVALQRLGQAEAAAAEWQQVLEVDLQTSEEPSFSEYVLTHYYLGDHERIGLGNILRILQEDKRYEWQTLFLAGLGWAIQEGGMENAKTNLQFAINQRRTAAQGKLLPYQTWTYLRDLLPEDTQQELRKYFETEWI